MQRSQNLSRLEKEAFDVLVIGGGATGAGIAVDAASRGLKVALVERGDFSSGTSSRSTKLVHGGVRYLEQAVMKFDRSQFRLVRDALAERKVMLQNAPHLVRWLPLLVPMYRRLEATYYHTGLRMYDWLAGKSLVHRSRLLSRSEALEECPEIRKSGLRGGVIYYDGQFDDARMNISLILTAEREGAAVANYVEVTKLLKKSGKLIGAEIRDLLSQGTFGVKAKAIVNATGPFTDSIRTLDDPEAKPILRVSSGSHLTIRAELGPQKMGVLIPKTEDKRVLFVLPWLGHALVGTTDNPAKVSENPRATSNDVKFMLKEFGRYFEKPLDPKDILSTWCGLRPLVQASGKQGKTASLSRDHYIGRSESGLLTVCGGKWTTYRLMAEDAVNELVREGECKAGPCVTGKLPVVGGAKVTKSLVTELKREYEVADDIARHLYETYGDQATQVLRSKRTERLVAGHPFIEAEVEYAAREEAAMSSADFLARRIRLWFLDQKAATEALPKVQSILAEALHWTDNQRKSDNEKFQSL